MQPLESPITPLTVAALRMIICKRPAPPDDHLQMAGPSKWSFVRGWSNNNNPGDLVTRVTGVKGQKEEKKENEKEEKKFLRADGHTDQPNKGSTRGA